MAEKSTEDLNAAYEIMKLFSERDLETEPLADYEIDIYDNAKEVISTVRRDSLRAVLHQTDIKQVSKDYKFLKNMDVESHSDVGKAQGVLKGYGYYTDSVDSLYGSNTKTARLQMESDALYHPEYFTNYIMEQARGLFDNWAD